MVRKIVIVSVGIVLLLSVISMIASIYNKEIMLANKYEAQEKIVENTLDTMRKKLINEFNVTNKFADDFIKVASVQSEGRKGGSLIKLNRESESLGIKQDVYMRMMNSVSGNLSEYKESQNMLVDIYREHKTYCEVFPNCLLIGYKVNKIKEPVIISSTVTKEAVKTKELNDKLF